MKLSIVIPVFNERDTLAQIVERVRAVKLPGVSKEIVLVDDCSSDGSRELIRDELTAAEDVTAYYHEVNLGKGAALRTGFAAATGELVVVQDGDLELDPADLPAVLQPLVAGRADVVFGSRFLDRGRGSFGLPTYLANRILTALTNRVYALSLTDMEAGYKAFRRSQLARITLRSERFGFEPEVTAKLARLGLVIQEVPVRYVGRSRAAGKKMRVRDGFKAAAAILWFRLFD